MLAVLASDGLLSGMAGHAVSPTVPGMGQRAGHVRVEQPCDRFVVRQVRHRRSAEVATRAAGARRRRGGGAGSLFLGDRRLRLLGLAPATSPGTWGPSRSSCDDETGKLLDDATLEIVAGRSCTWTGAAKNAPVGAGWPRRVAPGHNAMLEPGRLGRGTNRLGGRRR